MARPPYEPSEEHFNTAYLGAKKGLSEADISKSIGIGYRTFRKYKAEFSPHIKKGRAHSDDKNCDLVESAMLKSCLGWEYKETKKETKQLFDKVTGAAINTVEVKHSTVTKQVLPNPTLIMYYTANRNKARWQSINKQMIDTGSDIAIPVVSHLARAPEKVAETKVITKKGKPDAKKKKKLSKRVRHVSQKGIPKEKPGSKKQSKKNTRVKKGGQAGS